MQRRHALQTLIATALPVSKIATAHHGWSSFDLDRPVYLKGKTYALRSSPV
jgi:hypothetical protein